MNNVGRSAETPPCVAESGASILGSTGLVLREPDGGCRQPLIKNRQLPELFRGQCRHLQLQGTADLDALEINSGLQHVHQFK